MCQFIPVSTEFSLKSRNEYTLLLACVGVGNVGQLCMDVLISSTDATFAGYINSAYLPPIVGPSPYPELSSSPPLSCSLELYDDDSRKLSMLQVRVPVFPGARELFASEIAHFVLDQRFVRVVLLSSSFAMIRKDQQLRGPPLQFAATSNTSCEDTDALSRIGLTQLVEEEVMDVTGEGNPETHLALNLPGCGAALSIFKHLSNAQKTPAVLLNTFTCDGDNRNDAFFMAHALNGWLKVNPENGVVPWKTPKCWDMLYGSALNPALY